MTSAIIPKRLAPLRTLTVAMAVMCYLACVALGALFLINRAVDTWTSGLQSEVTVQLRETRSGDMDALMAAITRALNDTPGVVGSEVLDPSVGAKLLEPWLGTMDLAELPVPRLIRVRINPQTPPDFADLDHRLKSISKAVTLDTHQRWVGELSRMATSMSRLSWAVLALIALSAAAMVVVATRAALAANAETVAVLHMVGASDGFIARQIDRRFLATGLVAGIVGTLMGIVTFLLLGFSGSATSSSVSSAARDLISMPEGADWQLYAAMAGLPVAATLIAIVTSRLTLMRMLARQM